LPIDIDRVHALCFDVDGTLSDTDDLWVSRLHKFLSPIHAIFPGSDLRALARRVIMEAESPGNMAYELLDRLHLDNAAARTLQFIRRKDHGAAANYWLIPQADLALQVLKERYPLAVVSARGRLSTLAFLEQFHLLPHFRVVITGQTCRYTKPFPDPILAAAASMSVRPDECLMIGDTTVDIHAGRAAGAQTVGVLCGFGTETELRRAGADLILPGPFSLLDILLTPKKVDDSPGA